MSEEERRQLTEKEKELTNKALVELDSELEYYEKYLIPDVQLTLDTAEVVVKKQVADAEKKKRSYETYSKELKHQIEELKDQLKNGVKQKSSSEKSE